MKEIADTVFAVIDRSTFFPIAKRLAKDAKQVYYSNPAAAYSEELEQGTKGDGHPDVTLVEDYWLIKESVDVWVFPDCADIGPQQELRSQGRAVWGSGSVADLERFRGRWHNLCSDLGLPLPETKTVKGVSALRTFFKKHAYEDWYVKCSRWREMETWKACEPAQIDHKLDWLSSLWGPLKDQVVFYVQKPVKTEIESGADTYNVHGKWPSKIVLGYEKKGESYLATWKERDEMPPEVWEPMESISRVLADAKYANFISSEVRIAGSKSYWLDPCFRVPSPAGEEQLLLYKNLPEIIAAGANGELVEPEMAAKFCGEAVIEYNGDRGAWKGFEVPEKVRDKVALYANVYADDANHFGPKQDPIAIGCAVGMGDKPQDVIDELQEIAEELKDAPVTLHIAPMADLITEIETAEKEGIPFSEEPLPEPAAVLET